jgi:hypothetical protein
MNQSHQMCVVACFVHLTKLVTRRIVKKFVYTLSSYRQCVLCVHHFNFHDAHMKDIFNVTD